MEQITLLKEKLGELESERAILDHILREVGFSDGIDTLKSSIVELAELKAKEKIKLSLTN